MPIYKPRTFKSIAEFIILVMDSLNCWIAAVYIVKSPIVIKLETITLYPKIEYTVIY